MRRGVLSRDPSLFPIPVDKEGVPLRLVKPEQLRRLGAKVVLEYQKRDRLHVGAYGEDAELQHLRHVAEGLMNHLLSESNTNCKPAVILIREVVACKVSMDVHIRSLSLQS